MTHTIETHLLYEIALNQFADNSVDLTLSHALPLYQKKLYCFVAAVISNKNIIHVKPEVLTSDVKWKSLQEVFSQMLVETEKEVIEMADENNIYYIYPLASYGHLILGRKKPFNEKFKFELKKLVYQLGLNLIQAEEREESQELKKQLMTSDAHLKAVLDNTLYSIWSLDRNYCITYINDVFHNAFLAAFGVKLSIGSSILDALPDELKLIWKQRYDRIFNGERVSLEDIVQIQNHTIYIEITGSPIKKGDEIIGASFFGADITNRKLIEVTRDELLNRFEEIGSTVPGLIFQYCAKPDGTAYFPYVSNSLKRLFGISPEEVKESAALVLANIHKEDFPKVEASIIESARTMKKWELDFRIKLKNGEFLWVQGTAKPRKDKEGNYMWSGYLNDITIRKKAEEALLKFSRAIEQNPASVVITDSKGVIEYVNPKFTQITGYSLEECIGEKPNILKSGHQSDDVYEELWSTISKGNTWRGELYNKKKNGELFWEMASISPIINKEGKTTNYLAVKEDITELKNAETVILKNLVEKNILLSEVHHRVKNNMAIIYSLLGLQTEFSELNDETKIVIRDLQSRVKSMGIVHELVYENDNVSKISIIQLIEKVLGNLKSIYQQNDTEIDIELKADHFLMDLNRSVPFSLLINEILTNKWKHAFIGKTKGLIYVDIRKMENELSVIIKDNGNGVSDISKLENPVSYGYTIIHGLVNQLDGTITFQNIPNGGLEVSMKFPF